MKTLRSARLCNSLRPPAIQYSFSGEDMASAHEGLSPALREGVIRPSDRAASTSGSVRVQSSRQRSVGRRS